MVHLSRRLRISSMGAICLALAFTTFADGKFEKLLEGGNYEKAVEYAKKELPADQRSIDIWIDLAGAYQKLNDLDKAEKALQSAQKVNPSDPKIFLAYGDFHFGRKEYAKAVKAYQKSYLLDRTARAAEGIALTAAKLKDWDKARDAAESAVNLDSTVYEPRLILVDLYMKDGHYKAAAQQLEFAVSKEPKKAVYWKQLARAYDSTGNTAGLARADAKIVALDSKDVAARHRLAEYSLNQGDTDKAYELYKEIAVLTPDDPRPFEQLYQIAGKKDDKKNATLYLKNYLLLDSANAGRQKELGHLLYAQKDIDGALEAYRTALRLDPKITGLYKNYASIVIDKKLEDEAVRVITGAIEAKEADAGMLIALGDIYKKRKEYAKAIDMYQDALEKDAKNVTVLTSLAESQAHAGDLKNAINTYQQVVLLNAKARDEYKQLGILNMKIGKEENGIQAYKKYLAKAPDDGEAARIVGLYEHGKKQFDEAVKYLSMVKDEKLHTVAYLTALGDSYYQLGKYEKAAGNLAKVVAKKPSQTVLKNILKPLGRAYEKTGKHLEAAKAYDQYESLPGVRDEDVAYKRAHLREKSEKQTAVKVYTANTQSYPKDYRNYLRLGLIYAEDKNALTKSAAMLEKAAALIDTLPRLWETLGEVYGKLNKTDKELYAYKKLLALQPQDVKANKRVGLILIDKKETKTALAHLEVALTGAPKDEAMLLAVGEGYMKTGRPAEAAQALAKARDLDADDVDIRIALIEAYTKAGMKEEASAERDQLAALDKSIVSKDKKNIESRKRLAQYSLQKNDLKTAYSLYEDLASLTPKDTVVFKRLFTIALKNDQHKAAIGHLKKYLALDSTNAGAYKSLGNLLYEQKDMDGALKAYRQARTLDAGITGLYKRYIEIVLKKNLEDEAIRVITGAIAAKEADADAYIALGDIYKKRKDWKNAIAMYQEALQTETQNVEVLTSLAESQAARGDAKNAIVTYEQVVMINPKAVDEHKKLGDLHNKLGRTANAISAYKKYIAKKPDDGAVARTIGLHEYESKDYKEAIKYLTMVKDDKLRTVPYLVALGMSYYRTKDYANAVETLAKVQTHKPANAVRKETLRPLAESYEKINKPLEAADAYEAYAALSGVNDKDASFKRAYLREEKNKNEAIKMYTANVATFPKDHRNFLRLGLLYAKDAGKLKQSASMLSRAAALVDTLPVIWQTLGRVHGKLNNESGELQAFQKLLSLQPQDYEANKRVGAILLKQGKTSPALASLEMALTAKPGDVEVMLLLAEGYVKTDRPKQAINLLVKARESRKKDADIRMTLYNLYKKTGQNSKAEQEIKAVIGITKDNDHRQMYARDLLAKKRYDEAMKQVLDIKDSDPMNIEALMLLANIQVAQNKLNEAIETYKMISYVNDNYAPALSARGDVYLRLKEYSRAKDYYQKALKANARYAMAELGLARVAKARKDKAGYERHLAKAKSLDPKNESILAEVSGNGK